VIRRNALVTVAVLACLVVIVSLAASLVVSTLRARREVGVRYQIRQTDYLLDAGVSLAGSRFRDNHEYKGETWEPSNAVPGFHQAKVVIKVSREDEGTLGIEVIASLANRPADSNRNGAFVTQRSHRWSINPTLSSPSE
jgi:hypothetical protein